MLASGSASRSSAPRSTAWRAPWAGAAASWSRGDPRALAGALSRVLAGERLDPALGRACARQFTPSAAAAVYASAYRQLRQSRSHNDPASNARLRPAFHQPGHGAARVFGVLDQVQHHEQHDCRRLPEIEHLRRPAQNHPGITRVCLEVIGHAVRGALEQRLCVQGFLSRR